jgi:uncharacterized Fe-S cluster protein YjdI
MDKNDRDYSNDEITVHWRPAKCVHATICYSKLRSVFDPSRRPWIRMDKGTTEEIIDIVNQCPTDALTYTRIKDPQKKEEKEIESKKETENKEPATKIQIIENGPALVSGDFELKDINETKLAKANSIALCRCGKSKTLPFCDGTHNKIGFKENR